MPVEHPIPESVRKLIFDRIHSIEQLEVLLLVEADAARTWNVLSVADALKIAPNLAESALDHLANCELATVHAGSPRTWSYAPRSPALAASVAELARTYSETRVEVLLLISTHAIDRVRTEGLRTFAKAFLLRGPKKDG